MSLLIDPRRFPLWNAIIGQARVKQALDEKTLAILNGGALPCMGFYDAPGMGKSAITQSWGCEVARRSEGKVIAIYLNCKGNLNITSEEFKELCEYLYEALTGQGPAVLLFLDEFGTREAKGSGQAMLQAMLSKIGGDAVGGEPIQIYQQGEAVFNPHRLGVIVTSWAGGRIPADLKDRFKQTHDCTLDDYSPLELAEILKLSIARQLKMEHLPADSVKIHPSAIMLLARAMRGNARQADNPIAKKVATRIKARNGNYLLDKAEAKILREESGLLPYGISLPEKAILQHLAKAEDSVRGITASVGIGGEAFAIAQRFLRFGHKEEKPFQLFKPGGDEPIDNAFGSLVHTHGAKFGITKHGQKILSLL